MEILKVDVSLYKIIPVRQAQSGQILEGDVFGRNEEFIAERGTEIDEQLLNKFDNFNVRRLTVREHQETWVPDKQRARLPSDAQVLREEVFEGALEAPVQSLFGEEFETEIIRVLEAMIDGFEGREERELLNLREDVDELIDEVHRIREELEEYLECLKEIMRTLMDYREENETLHERVEESAQTPEDREYLENLMDGEEPFDPDRLIEMDVNMMLVEEIETHLKRRDGIHDSFEDVMWDLKTDSAVKR